ncbi:hypothetical protein [Vibrio sonorensis]|uniref:hypothetical protein n=1 Tax=Vibrio sonorensis TaxID=1004316 RepID=UPI0008DB1F03|nr:hypothetical protein [Vibrio sonorensis]
MKYKLIMPALDSYAVNHKVEINSNDVTSQGTQTSIAEPSGVIYIELDRDYEDPNLYLPITPIELEDENGERFVPEFGGGKPTVNGNKLKISFIKLR